jgi:hypothetical protein
MIDSKGNLWLHQKDFQFNCHKRLLERRKCLAFETSVFKEGHPPNGSIPTDYLTATGREIRTSKTDIAVKQKNPTASPANKWYSVSDPHISHLIGKIELLFDDEDTMLKEPNMIFEIASDGGHDPISGISTFGWVVAVNKQLLAKGRGPVEVHPQLAESFRAEGYGLASAGLFVQNLIRKYGIQTEKHSWRVYIDNKSLIQRMETYSEQFGIARWNLRPDEDITRAAHDIWRTVAYQLIHVKSHQDTHTDWDKLSFPAILNVIADEQATNHRNTMHNPTSTVKNLARVQLRIQDVAITRDSQQWILKAAGRIPIRQFYRDKYGWSPQTFESIHWELQKKSLQAFPTADQTRIIKFVHGWLPTQRWLHREGLATTPKCPLCEALVEDTMHLFACQHHRMQEVQEKLPLYLAKSLHDHGNSELTNIIEIGLASSITSKWEADPTMVSVEWRNAILEQNKIGWEHIYRGRIGRQLIEAMDQHYDQVRVNKMQYNGERWAKRLISNIWTIALELWATRSEIIYATSAETKNKQMREKVERRIQKCYEIKDKLTASERQKWFSQSANDLLQKDHKYLTAWLTIVERLFKIIRREERARPPESRLMERFLSMTNTVHQVWKRKNKKKKPRSFAQDMQPD